LTDVKMILTTAKDPDEYIECLTGWQRAYAQALRSAVRRAVPGLDESLKWGHIVYFVNGPVLLIRAEPTRVLFGFWRGQRLRHIEPRLKAGGKYEMATLELKPDTPLLEETVTRLAQEAAKLNRLAGDATAIERHEAGVMGSFAALRSHTATADGSQPVGGLPVKTAN
jgi:hypothetical protein